MKSDLGVWSALSALPISPLLNSFYQIGQGIFGKNVRDIRDFLPYFLANTARTVGNNDIFIFLTFYFYVLNAVSERLFALIPSAGIGSRAGQPFPKQYRMIAGRDILHHTLCAFDACHEITKTLVVLAPEDRHFDSRRFSGLRFVVRRCGGALRQETVLNGLEVLAELGASDEDWVLVHDAARPGITPTLIRNLIHSVRDDEVGGILAMPITDALKRAQAQEKESTSPHTTRRILCRESKKDMWLAQTPQMFRIGALREALTWAQQTGQSVDDEAEVMERMGHKPRMIVGSWRNFKVTYPDDFDALEGLLASDISGLQVSDL